MADTIYKVKREDTLSGIADMYKTLLGVNTSQEAIKIILKNNPQITDENYIVVGQKIWITGEYITYVTKKGDTLSSIAETYKKQLGVKKSYPDGALKLQKLNPEVKDIDKVFEDQEIKLWITYPGTVVKESTSTQPIIKIIGLQSNATATRTVYVSWTFDKDNVDRFEVNWQYYAKTAKKSAWFNAKKVIVNHDELRQSTYDAPLNALQVRADVLPYSTTYKSKPDRKGNTKDVPYWKGKKSKQESYKFSSSTPDAPSTPTVTVDKYTITARLDNLNINATHIQFNIISESIKDDGTTEIVTVKVGSAEISKNSAIFSFDLSSIPNYGSREYKVRARSYRDGLYSGWSEYSSAVSTVPEPPSKITTCRASSKTSVYLEWKPVKSAKTYEIQYATKLEYFEGSDALQQVTGIETTKYEKTGLETVSQYFFRLRAVNDKGSSDWTEIVSVTIGFDPESPTTWSSTTTATIGEQLILYWVHNAKDNSSQTVAELEITANGTTNTYTIENDQSEENKDKTSTYVVDTKVYAEGTKIQWRVRTAGVTRVYGNWSIMRTVDVYAAVSLDFRINDNNDDVINAIESFPIKISAIAGPKTQAPISYHLEIIANEGYETIDDTGNVKIVSSGESIYSKYFDITSALDVNLSAGDIDLENNIKYTATCIVSMNSGLTAKQTIDFIVAWEDDEYEPTASVVIDDDSYTASIRPYCDDIYGNFVPDILLSVYRREFDGTFTEIASGIENLIENEYENLVETSITFLSSTPLEVEMTSLMKDQTYSVYWNGTKYICDSKIIKHSNGTISVYIGNKSIDNTGLFDSASDSGEPFFIVSLLDEDETSIYNYSTFQNASHASEAVTVRIVGNISVNNTWVTDPHPALDYARYRIVATTKSTGAISYSDLPGYPVDGDSVIIQWNEKWSNFDNYNEDGSPITDSTDSDSWEGSMIKLPYNIDVSEKNAIDIELVEYIGREYPVSYYGTQIGTTATWSMVIPKDDVETLYALRRLARWKGDAYVREPSGVGYWANIVVSMSQKHREVTIPVSMSITRVEGGI